MKKLTLAMLCAALSSAPAGANEFAQCHEWPANDDGLVQQAQLWNPPDSGVTLHLDRIHLHSDRDAGWNIIATNQAFPELRNPGHTRLIGAQGKSAGNGELRGIANQNRGKYQVYSLYVWSAPANIQLTETVDIEIPPGWGLAVASRVAGASLAACFDWSEMPLLERPAGALKPDM